MSSVLPKFMDMQKISRKKTQQCKDGVPENTSVYGMGRWPSKHGGRWEELEGCDDVESKAQDSLKQKIEAKQVTIHGCKMKTGKCPLYLDT